jgi:hypothetical protein
MILVEIKGAALMGTKKGDTAKVDYVSMDSEATG